MNKQSQVWVVSGTISEPRQTPLWSAKEEGDFFTTEAEAYDFIADRELAEARHKQCAADSASARARTAKSKADATRAKSDDRSLAAK